MASVRSSLLLNECQFIKMASSFQCCILFSTFFNGHLHIELMTCMHVYFQHGESFYDKKQNAALPTKKFFVFWCHFFALVSSCLFRIVRCVSFHPTTVHTGGKKLTEAKQVYINIEWVKSRLLSKLCRLMLKYLNILFFLYFHLEIEIS